MIGRDNRTKILVVSKRHAVVMHGIAKLALFCYSLLILSSLMSVIFYLVLVSKYHYLPCYETDQDDPGINNVLIALFQNLNARILQ
jgi:hypothetical protein